MYSGVIVLDGNRARFSMPDWKAALAVKVLRTRLRDLLTRSFRTPGRLPTAQQEKWLDTWQRIFSQEFGDRERGVGNNSGSGNGNSIGIGVGGGGNSNGTAGVGGAGIGTGTVSVIPTGTKLT